MEAYPDNELKEPVLIAEGDLVCFHARFVGMHAGALRRPNVELPPTGKPIDTPFAFIAEVRDDNPGTTTTACLPSSRTAS